MVLLFEFLITHWVSKESENFWGILDQNSLTSKNKNISDAYIRSFAEKTTLVLYRVTQGRVQVCHLQKIKKLFLSTSGFVAVLSISYIYVIWTKDILERYSSIVK